MRKVELCKLALFSDFKERFSNVFIYDNGVLCSFRKLDTIGRKLKPRIIKGVLNEDGYIRDDLSVWNHGKRFLIRLTRHQLVAMAFHGYNMGDYKLGVELDHIDRNILNNSANNLRKVDRQGNIDNSDQRKLSNRKFTEDQIVDMYRMFRDGKTNVDISKVYGVSYQSINLILSGKTYKDVFAKRVANLS